MIHLTRGVLCKIRVLSTRVRLEPNGGSPSCPAVYLVLMIHLTRVCCARYVSIMPLAPDTLAHQDHVLQTAPPLPDPASSIVQCAGIGIGIHAGTRIGTEVPAGTGIGTEIYAGTGTGHVAIQLWVMGCQAYAPWPGWRQRMTGTWPRPTRCR